MFSAMANRIVQADVVVERTSNHQVGDISPSNFRLYEETDRRQDMANLMVATGGMDPHILHFLHKAKMEVRTRLVAGRMGAPE